MDTEIHMMSFMTFTLLLSQTSHSNSLAYITEMHVLLASIEEKMTEQNKQKSFRP